VSNSTASERLTLQSILLSFAIPEEILVRLAHHAQPPALAQMVPSVTDGPRRVRTQIARSGAILRAPTGSSGAVTPGVSGDSSGHDEKSKRREEVALIGCIVKVRPPPFDLIWLEEPLVLDTHKMAAQEQLQELKVNENLTGHDRDIGEAVLAKESGQLTADPAVTDGVAE